MWRLLLLTLLITGCSLGALDGFSGGVTPSAPNDSGIDSATEREGGTGFIERDAASSSDADSGSGSGRCITGSSADSICDDFDLGAPHSTWTTAANSGSFSIVATGRSLPNALSFTLPNVGASSTIGPAIARTFTGRYSSLECSFAGALDEVPGNGTSDFFGVINAATDEAGIRLFASGFRLISCRSSSDCKPEVNAGTLPTLGTFHDYRAVWSGSGTFQFYLDGELRGTITSITPVSNPLTATANLGLLYRVYGTGGSFRARVDDVECRRTP